MANGYRAGVAKITIRPDLDNFKKQLQQQIHRALEGYVADINANLNIGDAERTMKDFTEKPREADVNVNVKGDEKAKTKVKNAAKDQNSTIHVDADTSDADKAMSKSQRKAEKARQKAQKRDEKNARRTAKLSEDVTQDVTVNIETDGEAEAQAAKDALAEDVDTTVHFDTDEKSAKKVEERIDDIGDSKPVVKIRTDLDESKLRKDLADLDKKFEQARAKIFAKGDRNVVERLNNEARRTGKPADTRPYTAMRSAASGYNAAADRLTSDAMKGGKYQELVAIREGIDEAYKLNNDKLINEAEQAEVAWAKANAQAYQAAVEIDRVRGMAKRAERDAQARFAELEKFAQQPTNRGELNAISRERTALQETLRDLEAVKRGDAVAASSRQAQLDAEAEARNEKARAERTRKGLIDAHKAASAEFDHRQDLIRELAERQRDLDIANGKARKESEAEAAAAAKRAAEEKAAADKKAADEAAAAAKRAADEKIAADAQAAAAKSAADAKAADDKIAADKRAAEAAKKASDEVAAHEENNRRNAERVATQAKPAEAVASVADEAAEHDKLIKKLETERDLVKQRLADARDIQGNAKADYDSEREFVETKNEEAELKRAFQADLAEEQAALAAAERDHGNNANALEAAYARRAELGGSTPPPAVSPEPAKAETTPPPAVAEKPIKTEPVEETAAEMERRIAREEAARDRIAGISNSDAARTAAEIEAKAQKIAAEKTPATEKPKPVRKSRAKADVPEVSLAEMTPAQLRTHYEKLVKAQQRKITAKEKHLAAKREEAAEAPEFLASVEEFVKDNHEYRQANKGQDPVREHEDGTTGPRTAAQDVKALKDAQRFAKDAPKRLADAETSLASLKTELQSLQKAAEFAAEATKEANKAQYEASKDKVAAETKERAEAERQKRAAEKLAQQNEAPAKTERVLDAEGRYDPYETRKQHGDEAMRAANATLSEDELRSIIKREDIAGASSKSDQSKLVEILNHAVTYAQDKGKVFRDDTRAFETKDDQNAALDKRIRDAYDKLLTSESGWVRLSRMRDELNDVAREQLDEGFRRVSRSRSGNLIPEENQKTLSDQDRLDAVELGNQQNHLISFNDRPRVEAANEAADTKPDLAAAEARADEAQKRANQAREDLANEQRAETERGADRLAREIEEMSARWAEADRRRNAVPAAPVAPPAADPVPEVVEDATERPRKARKKAKRQARNAALDELAAAVTAVSNTVVEQLDAVTGPTVGTAQVDPNYYQQEARRFNRSVQSEDGGKNSNLDYAKKMSSNAAAKLDVANYAAVRAARDQEDAVNDVALAEAAWDDVRKDSNASALTRLRTESQLASSRRALMERTEELSRAEFELTTATNLADQAQRYVIKTSRMRSVEDDKLARSQRDAEQRVEGVRNSIERTKYSRADEDVTSLLRPGKTIETLRPKDAQAASDYLTAAKQADAADKASISSRAALQKATNDLRLAEVQYANAIAVGKVSAEERLRMDNRIAAARDRLTAATRADSEAESRRVASDANLNNARGAFNDRRKTGRLGRAAEVLSSVSTQALDALNNKILLVGRQLSAVASIARFGGMAIAALGAVNIVPLISSLSQVANIGALLPAIFTAAGAAIAAMVIGANGIGEAFKAATKQTKNADKDMEQTGKAREQAAKQQANAQKSLDSAVRNQAKTAQSGARSIVSAEKSVANAKKGSVTAEKQLIAARKDAIDNIADLNDALKGNALDEESAAIAVERARESMGRALSDPTATSLDRREADLGVRQAIHNLEQIKKSNREARDEASTATKLGVEGDEQVIAAKEGIVEANDNVAEAEESLAQTRADAADANAEAARSVADAQEALAEATANTAEVVADLGGSTDEFNAAMEKLSPNAQRFVLAMRELGDEWTSLRKQVQDNLFGGLDESVTRLANQQLPNLQSGLSSVAREINTGLLASIDQLSKEQSKVDFRRFFVNTTRATGILAAAFRPATQAFIDLTTVGSDRLPRMAEAITNTTQKFADLIAKARDSGRLDQIIATGIDKFKTIGGIIADVAVSIRRVFQAIRGEGDGMLENLAHAAQRMRDFLDSTEGNQKVQDFFAQVNETFGRFMSVAGDLVSILTESVFPAFSTIGSILGPIIVVIADLVANIINFGDVLEYALTAFLAWKAISTISGLLVGFQVALGAATIGVAGLWASMRAMGIWGILATAIGTATTAVGKFRTALMNNLGAAGLGAVLLGLFAIQQGVSGIGDKFAENEQIMADHVKSMVEYSQQLKDALAASGGVANESVRGIISSEFVDQREDLAEKIANRPSAFEGFIKNGIGSGNGTILGLGRETTDKYDATNDAANRAQVAQEGLDKVMPGASDKEWGDVISSMDGSYESVEMKLRGMGDAGSAALDVLGPLREEFIKQRDASSQYASILEQVQKGQLSVVDATDQLTAANARQRGENQNLERAQAAANDQVRAFGKFVNEGYNAEAANGFTAAVVEANGAINTSTESGSQLFKQIEQIQQAYDRAYNAAYTESKQRGETEAQAVQAARNAADGIRNSMRATLESTGMASESIDALLAQYELTDQDILTNFDANIDPATGKLVTLTDTINGTTATIKVDIDYSEVLGKANEFGKFSPAAMEAAGITVTDEYRAKYDSGELKGADGIPLKDTATGPLAPGQASPEMQKLPPNMVAIQDQWQKFVDSIDGQFNGKVLPALDGINARILTIADSWAAITQPIIDNINLQAAAMENLAKVYTDAVDTGINPKIASVAETMLSMSTVVSVDIPPIIATGLIGIIESFTSMMEGVSISMNAMKAVVAQPFNWIIDNVINTGMKEAWNSVRTVIPSLPEYTATAPRIEGFHTGGIMPGYTPGVDNKIIAVGGGEAIMRPEVTRALGPEWVNTMNKTARSGGVAGVRKLRDKLDGAYSNGGIVDSMEAVISEKFPGMKLTSGIRQGDPGYHGKAMAGDFSNAGTEGSPEMKSLAQWIYDNFLSSTIQLIHSPFNNNIGDYQNVGDGMSRYYDPATMADHLDHVHWALNGPITGEGTTDPIAGALIGGGGGLAAAANSAVGNMFSKPMADLKAKMPDWGPTLFGGELPRQFMSTLMDEATKAIGGARNTGGSIDAGVTPWIDTAGADQWEPNIRAALAREGFPVTDANVAITKKQIMTESSGNPNAIQTVQDVNSGGNEGVGLVQVIPGTFAAYRNPDLPNDRTNPDASLSAGLRWYRHKWGDDLSTMWGKGHGYDQGGVFENGTVGWNTSGKPEAVFTNSQWMRLDELVRALTRPDVYETLTNTPSSVNVTSTSDTTTPEDKVLDASENMTVATDQLAVTAEQLAEQGVPLDENGTPTNYKPEDSYTGSKAPIKPTETAEDNRTPWLKAVTGLGKAMLRPDTAQRLSDPGYHDRMVQLAKDRNAQSDAAFAAGNDELGRQLSDLPAEMGYDPGTQAQLATMGSSQEMFSQWQQGTAKNFESYLRDNWQGMAESLIGGIGGATYQIGSIQTNSWTDAQRQIDRRSRRKSRSNSRAGGR